MAMSGGWRIGYFGGVDVANESLRAVIDRGGHRYVNFFLRGFV
jgi:hypothetical protein